MSVRRSTGRRPARKTVEFHLSRTYRKLGIRSRAELVRRFTEAESDPPAGRPLTAGGNG